MKKGSSQNDKKVIELLKKYPKGLFRQEIQKNTKIPQSRLTESLKRLTERFIIRQVERYDQGKSKTMKDRYYLTALEGLADPNKLHEIMEFYRKAKKDNNKPLMIELQKEIEDIFLNFNIRDKKFINFVIEEAKQINQDTHIMRKCLGHLAINLRKDINMHTDTIEYVFDYDEKQFLQMIVSSQDQLEKIIFDRKRSITERLEIFDTISQFTTVGIVDIAFNLLTKLDTIEKKYDKEKEKITEFQIFIKDIEEVILRYAQTDIGDCKKRLWEILTPKTDKIIANKIKNLLETIREKSHSKQETYTSQRSLSSPGIAGRPFSRLGTSFSLSYSEISDLKEMLRERRTSKPFVTFSSLSGVSRNLSTITGTKKKINWLEK